MPLKPQLRKVIFLTFLATLVVACQPADSPEPMSESEALVQQHENAAVENAEARNATLIAWDEFIEQYLEDFLLAHPAFAVALGRHEFDGMLPDWSPEGIDREIARLKLEREKVLGFGNEGLGDEGRYQREYLLAAIDGELFWLEKADWPYVNPSFYIDGGSDWLDPSPYITLDYAPLDERMKAYTRFAGNIPRAAEQIRANLRMPMARTRLQYGIDSFGGMADYFTNDVPAVFSTVDDEGLQAEFATANAAAAKAMQDLADWLKSNLDSATEDYALGPDLFQQMIYDTERVDISLPELEEMGQVDMKRNQIALGEACAEFAPGESIRSCFAMMANRKPPGGTAETARLQMEETRAFLLEKNLVSIPGNEMALVAEAPPYARSDLAYINIPGPFEKDQPSVYYISPPNPDWSQDLQQSYIPGESDLLFTSVHEVWPGHFLNFLHANRAKWILGRVFVTYAFSEGWAHYTEEMMLDAGLRGASAETRIGQLGNALLRNARFLSAIGLHTQGMTVEESEKLFMEEAYQDEGTARQQAARGTYDPGYLNYTLGKLMIRDLRNDWTELREGPKSWREFHDTFLSFGGPPIPLVRTRMMKTPPENDG